MSKRQKFIARIEVIKKQIPYSSLKQGNLFVEPYLTDFTDDATVFKVVWKGAEARA